MRFVVLIIMFVGVVWKSQGQDYNLRTKLAYCGSEVDRLEVQLARYTDLMGMQNKEVLALKQKMSELKDEIAFLEEENAKLKEVALNMYYLAQRFEEDNNLKAAVKMYKLLIKTYPTSLQATSSRIKVTELQPIKKKQ